MFECRILFYVCATSVMFLVKLPLPSRALPAYPSSMPQMRISAILRYCSSIEAWKLMVEDMSGCTFVVRNKRQRLFGLHLNITLEYKKGC
jgi:hypothetical protein